MAVWLGNGVNAPTTTGMIAGAVPAEWTIENVVDLNGDDGQMTLSGAIGGQGTWRCGWAME